MFQASTTIMIDWKVVSSCTNSRHGLVLVLVLLITVEGNPAGLLPDQIQNQLN